MPDKAEAISTGAGLKGMKAEEFVKNQKKAIGAITTTQQVKLFENTYPTYEKRARKTTKNGLLQ